MTEGDPVLKKSSTFILIPDLKKKLRNKSLNDFEEMFTQKEENLSEETDAKGLKAKGQKLPQKDAKDAKNGKKKGKWGIRWSVWSSSQKWNFFKTLWFPIGIY